MGLVDPAALRLTPRSPRGSRSSRPLDETALRTASTPRSGPAPCPVTVRRSVSTFVGQLRRCYSRSAAHRQLPDSGPWPPDRTNPKVHLPLGAAQVEQLHRVLHAQ